MSNLLSKGQAMLSRHLQRAASPTGTLTYRPVANPTDEIDLTGQAWVGREGDLRITKEGGINVISGVRDYLIPVTVLPNEPQRGDRIVEVIQGLEVVYEAIEPLGEPAWRYSDPGHTIYRVHTKKQVG